MPASGITASLKDLTKTGNVIIINYIFKTDSVISSGAVVGTLPDGFVSQKVGVRIFGMSSAKNTSLSTNGNRLIASDELPAGYWYTFIGVYV